MSVWLCIPSARPVAEVNALMAKWRERGYKIALWRDGYSPELDCDKQLFGSGYPGYAVAVNRVIEHVLREDPTCDWCVIGGDDVEPDPTWKADHIAMECSIHFAGTLGIMQPTGHRWGENEPWARANHPNEPAYIDRICGSPFLGREWCLRGNQGAGPLHPGFWHMHGDECLKEVAQKLGILWQRPDLTHFHNHWGLTGDQSKMPAFLAKANSPEHWAESKALLQRLRTMDFVECMPLQSGI